MGPCSDGADGDVSKGALEHMQNCSLMRGWAMNLGR